MIALPFISRKTAVFVWFCMVKYLIQLLSTQTIYQNSDWNMKIIMFLLNFLVDQNLIFYFIFHFINHFIFLQYFQYFLNSDFYKNYILISKYDQQESCGLIQLFSPFFRNLNIIWFLSFNDLKFYLIFWSKVINFTIYIYIYSISIYGNITGFIYLYIYIYMETLSTFIYLQYNYKIHEFILKNYCSHYSIRILLN